MLLALFVGATNPNEGNFPDSKVPVSIDIAGERDPAKDVKIVIHEVGSIEKWSTLLSNGLGMAETRLVPGDYYLLARTIDEDIGAGSHAYQEFRISESEDQKKLLVEMRPDSNHSVSVDLLPDFKNIDIPDNHIAVYSQNDKSSPPVLIDQHRFETACRKRGVRKTPENSPDDEGDMVWLYGTTYLVVENEQIINQWHPVALVDSEPGVIHEFYMSNYDEEEMTFESEIEATGLGGSYTYEDTITFELDIQDPTVATDGDVRTRLGEFRHIYQSGSIMYHDGLFWHDLGDFQREFIDKWYTMSVDELDGAQGISETRDEYRGEWRIPQLNGMNLKITDSDSHTHVFGFDVERKDVFGASAKIQFTNTHIVKTTHHVSWTQPYGDNWALRFYGGNMFDLNMYDYIYEDGGGCPFVSEWNGTGYALDNNLLPQSEIFGGESDWVDRYKLATNPLPRYGMRHLMISEFEQEVSSLDEVELLAVSHDAATRVGITPSGDIMSYMSPHPPEEAWANNETNIANLLGCEDGDYYSGEKGDEVILKFENAQFKSGARLVMRADADQKFSIHVDIKTINGWSEIAVVIPRIRWSHNVIPIAESLARQTTEPLIVRLTWTAHHKLDFIGIDTKPMHQIEIQRMQLQEAIHSEKGSVLGELQYSDDVHANLSPGEKIYLYFECRKERSKPVDFVIVVEGRYYTID
ncbi:MAG: hypothetical protein R6V83_00405 [Candidatus Thorarchaeota archaeon]